MSFLESFLSHLFHDGRALGQHFEAGGLSTARLTNQHHTKSDVESVVELNDLILELRAWL